MIGPRLTVGELKRKLLSFPDDTELRFIPKECSPMGWPEWLDAHVYRADDGRGIVFIEIQDVLSETGDQET